MAGTLLSSWRKLGSFNYFGYLHLCNQLNKTPGLILSSPCHRVSLAVSNSILLSVLRMKSGIYRKKSAPSSLLFLTKGVLSNKNCSPVQLFHTSVSLTLCSDKELIDPHMSFLISLPWHWLCCSAMCCLKALSTIIEKLPKPN